MHDCPAPECTARVPDTMLACRRHWFTLSMSTRSAVWKAYREDGPGSFEHRAAVAAAVAELNP